MHIHTASPGKYRVTGYDTFEGPNADFPIGEYDTLKEAKDVADERSGLMTCMYVHDDRGKQLHKAGTV